MEIYFIFYCVDCKQREIVNAAKKIRGRKRGNHGILNIFFLDMKIIHAHKIYVGTYKVHIISKVVLQDDDDIMTLATVSAYVSKENYYFYANNVYIVIFKVYKIY